MAVKAEPVPVCFPFVGDRLGGSHISAVLLIENLDRRRFEPLVVLHRSDGAVAGFLESKGIPFQVLHLPALVSGKKNAVWADVRTLLRNVIPLFRFLRANKVEVVHTQDLRRHLTWSGAAFLAGAVLGYSFRIC